MITSQVANQEIFVTAVSIARALKVKAPIAALPIPGHSPLCFHRTKLAAALKGVTPTSITCEMGESPAPSWGRSEPGAVVRYLVVKGYAGNVKTSFRAVPLDVREARKLVTAWASRQRVKKAAPAKVKPTADTFQGDSPEVELENALRSLESFRHQIRRSLFPGSSYESASPARFAAWHQRKAERIAVNTPIYTLGKQYTQLTARIQELACSRMAHTKAEAKEFSSLQKERHAVEVQRNKALRARDKAIKATPDLMTRPRLVPYLKNERPSASELAEINRRIAGAKSIIVALALETENYTPRFAMAEEAKKAIDGIRLDIKAQITNCRTPLHELNSIRSWVETRAERKKFARFAGKRYSSEFMANYNLMQEYTSTAGGWVSLRKPELYSRSGGYRAGNGMWAHGTLQDAREHRIATLREAKAKLRTAARITAEIQTRIAQQVAA